MDRRPNSTQLGTRSGDDAPNINEQSEYGPGGAGYSWAKRTLIGYVEEMS